MVRVNGKGSFFVYVYMDLRIVRVILMTDVWGKFHYSTSKDCMGGVRVGAYRVGDLI
jgi:hypothetical protein